MCSFLGFTIQNMGTPAELSDDVTSPSKALRMKQKLKLRISIPPNVYVEKVGHTLHLQEVSTHVSLCMGGGVCLAFVIFSAINGHSTYGAVSYVDQFDG